MSVAGRAGVVILIVVAGVIVGFVARLFWPHRS